MTAARARGALFLIVFAALLVAAGARVGPASATGGILLVTNCNDSGAGSLRDRVAAADGDRVLFSGGTHCNGASAIHLTSPITVSKLMSIEGGTGRQSITGGDTTALFDVQASGDVSLAALDLTDGGGMFGGAVTNAGHVLVINTTITSSSATIGGAINNFGSLDLQGATLSGNGAFSAPGGGAIYSSSGTVNVITSTFTNNAVTAAGAGGGALRITGGSATIDRSTFTGNIASGGGGGAIDTDVTLALHNSTLSGNNAATGGAVFNGSGTTTIENDTFAANTSSGAGNAIAQGGGTVTAANTIVSGSGGSNCSGTVTDNGHNLQFGDSTCGFSLMADPLLGALASNGGATQTMALGVGSPAIGAADAAVCQSAAVNDVDQRNRTRDAGARGVCDIGAYDTGGGTTKHVINCNGSGQGSLSAEIAGATSGDTILFNLDCTGGSAIIPSARILIPAMTLTIDGSGHSITVSGNDVLQILQVQSGATVTLSHLTMTHANGSSNGGAIVNLGNLTVQDSTFTHNVAGDGSAIGSFGTLVVERSTFDGNGSTSAIVGGAIQAGGSATIRTSTFSNNTVNGGGGALQVIGASSTMIVESSTFTGNSANGGGAIRATTGATLTLRNSTLTGNTAISTGGGVTVFSGSTGTLENNTISGNTAPSGSQIDAGGTANVANTIVSGSGGNNCSGTVTDNGHNLQFGDSTCGFSLTGDPLLGALASNGGPTQTMALGSGSPAIGHGDATVCQSVGIGNVDQRGSARNAGARGRCDIGAYDTGAGTTRHVTNCSSSGSGSLSDVVALATDDDTVVFDQNCTGGSTIVLSSEMIVSGRSFAIDGTGHSVTVSGNDTVRMFEVQATGDLTISHLTLTNGHDVYSGGAIWVAGTVTLQDSVVKNSVADGSALNSGGGGIWNAGGTLTVQGSTFQNNSGGSSGLGGAIGIDSGTTTIRTSTFTGNSAPINGGALYAGSGVTTVERSTFSGNSTFDGGAIYSYNGATLNLRNSTLTGNTATNGGAIHAFGSTVALQNDTIASNTAGGGGGFLINNGGTITVSNSIVAQNGGQDCGIAGGGSIVDGGNNLGGFGCGFALGGDPLLGALGDNGGPTQTMALGAGSPAIAAGSSSVCLAAGVGDIDQRGHTRNAGSRGACDIGAYDTGGGASSLHVTNCNSSGTGSFSEITSAANSGDTVVFDLNCSGPSQIAVPGEIAIGSRTVIVDGGGHQVTLNGNDSVRFFSVGAAGSLSLKQLTLTHGHASGDGGAILSAGLLGLRNVSITRSVATGNGGAISSSSLLSIQGGTLDNNGAIGDGGALAVSGTTGVQGVTLTSNNANNNGGAIESTGTLTVNRSMFNGNSAADGGALYSSAGTLSLLNSTLSFNLQTGGGGGGLSVYGGTATVRNSTLVEDQTFGFGAQEVFNGGGSVSVGNSILLASDACGGAVTDGGYNLTDSFDSSCGFTDHAVSTPNAQIGNLANNGGPTWTMALAGTSPAVGAGSASMCQAAGINNIDQRLRPRNAGARGVCDIGAYDTGASGPSAATTLIKRSPGKIVADGSSTATVTVVARDAAGHPVTVGGATVTLSTTLGNLSSVTDNGNGTYTATLTSVTTLGTAHITGTLNASPIVASTGVDFVPGGPSGTTTTINRAPNRIVADGVSTATITVRARDANGNVIQGGGATVLLNTNLGSLGGVTDNNNGTYTATLTSATTRGKATVSGSINGDPIAATTSVDFVPGPPSGATTTIGRSPSQIVADGVTTSTITVRAKDANGNVIQVGGATVVLNTTRGSLGSVTDNGNGTYTATLTSSTSRGVATIGGTINSDPIVSTASVDFIPGPPSGAATTIVRSAASIPADGTSTVTITVRAKDQFGNLEQTGGAGVTLNTTLGTLGSVTDNNNGTYSATLTSSSTPGTATITGTINSQAITGGGTSVTFT